MAQLGQQTWWSRGDQLANTRSSSLPSGGRHQPASSGHLQVTTPPSPTHIYTHTHCCSWDTTASRGNACVHVLGAAVTSHHVFTRASPPFGLIPALQFSFCSPCRRFTHKQSGSSGEPSGSQLSPPFPRVLSIICMQPESMYTDEID